MKCFNSLNDMSRFSLAPRFTVVHHPIREKYGLTMAGYALIDSIDQLSNRPGYDWCTTPKAELGKWIGITRSTVYEAIKVGFEKGLIEKNDRGDLRTTDLWISSVRLYQRRSNEEID